MRTIVLLLFLSIATTLCFSQRTQRVMIGVHADLIKSDNDGFFEKVQGGLEGSYYFSRKFAGTTGIEWWSDHGNPVFLIGSRFAPIDEAFFRVRWLTRKDVSFGAGFAKPISENVRLEAMADFYLDGQIAIRGGIAYGLGRNP